MHQSECWRHGNDFRGRYTMKSGLNHLKPLPNPLSAGQIETESSDFGQNLSTKSTCGLNSINILAWKWFLWTLGFVNILGTPSLVWACAGNDYTGSHITKSEQNDSKSLVSHYGRPGWDQDFTESLVLLLTFGLNSINIFARKRFLWTHLFDPLLAL